MENFRYSDWYSEQIQNFIDELKEKKFNPTWGLGVGSNINTMSEPIRFKFVNPEILSPYASRTDARFRIIKYLENNVNLPV